VVDEGAVEDLELRVGGVRQEVEEVLQEVDLAAEVEETEAGVASPEVVIVGAGEASAAAVEVASVVVAAGRKVIMFRGL
jgi:alkyl hydroperoxide reductase subunit AhpF